MKLIEALPATSSGTMHIGPMQDEAVFIPISAEVNALRMWVKADSKSPGRHRQAIVQAQNRQARDRHAESVFCGC